MKRDARLLRGKCKFGTKTFSVCVDEKLKFRLVLLYTSILKTLKFLIFKI